MTKIESCEKCGSQLHFTDQHDEGIDVLKAAVAAIESPNIDGYGDIELEGNAPLTIFPFFTVCHYEVVLRHNDGESQDIELTPDEADRVADMLKAAAQRARELKAQEL